MPETVPIFDDPGDTELLASAMRGSKAALNTLADRHYNGVLLYLASQSITPEQASDLTQETFYDLFRSLDSITPDRPLRAWLLVAARNNLLHHLRQERFRTHASFDQILEQGVRPHDSSQSTTRHFNSLTKKRYGQSLMNSTRIYGMS